MLTKKLIAILLIFCFIFPSISMNVLASSQNDQSESDNHLRLIMKLLQIRFNGGFLDSLSLGRYFYRQLRPPVAIQAYPDAVDLRYLNETVFQIGGKNNVTGEWEKMIKVAGGWDFAWLNPQITFYFEFVPPVDAPDGVWNVIFDPPQVLMKTSKTDLDWFGAETPFRTNVTIQLKPSVDPTYPTQDVVLKFNIVREEALNHIRILSGTPRWIRTDKELYIEKMNEMDPDLYKYWDSFFNIFMWNRLNRRVFFFLNLRFPPYDKWVDSTVEILIRVNKYHQVDIIPPEPVEIEPYEVKSIPVTIKNIGSHIDTFNFRVSTDEKNMLVTPPPALTLKPGEEVEALVGVAAPKRFLSIGSMSSIFLEAYSVDDPDNVFPQTITLSTVGINVTGGSTYNLVSILITIFVIIAVAMYLLRRRMDKIVIKPEKPWEIPEEKKYLDNLKEKDKKKYNETLSMMEDEYKSAILWHRYYCTSLIRKGKTSGKKIEFKPAIKKLSNSLNKTLEKIRNARKERLKAKEKRLKAEERKLKAETKKIEPKKEEIKKEKPVKEEPKKVEVTRPKELKVKKEKIVDKKAEFERKRKQRVIEKIRRAQDKQVRRISD